VVQNLAFYRIEREGGGRSGDREAGDGKRVLAIRPHFSTGSAQSHRSDRIVHRNSCPHVRLFKTDRFRADHNFEGPIQIGLRGQFGNRSFQDGFVIISHGRMNVYSHLSNALI